MKKILVKKTLEPPPKKVLKKIEESKIKKQKKEYPKDGQKKVTPPENDPLRKFYTSLLKQNPHSEMAIKWCIDHGLYPNQTDNICYKLSKIKI